MKGQDKVDIELRMTAKQAREFADALTDDEFRGRIQADPRSELAAFGIFISEEYASGSVVLPEIDELDELLDEIPGGSGFRAEPDETAFHVIVWFAGALARSHP